MSHILLLPFGTSGSIFPFIWLGRKLLKRGHRVTMIASPVYEKSAVSAGIGFFPPESDGLPLMLADSSLWQPRSCKRVKRCLEDGAMRSHAATHAKRLKQRPPWPPSSPGWKNHFQRPVLTGGCCVSR